MEVCSSATCRQPAYETRWAGTLSARRRFRGDASYQSIGQELGRAGSRVGDGGDDIGGRDAERKGRREGYGGANTMNYWEGLLKITGIAESMGSEDLLS